ncbi:MAG: hypothetical protein ACRC8Q_04900 [Aeromonas sp.]
MHNNLMVPMLLGRDWAEFDQLLTSRGPPSGGARGQNRRRPANQHSHRPPLMATESELEGECNSPNLFSDLFQQVMAGGSFGREQREDE